jgi:non-canonical (house-cleaning) NTP pyrophosphatase
MSARIMKYILEDGMELADVMDMLTGETDVRSHMGAMGVLTAGHLARAEAYAHGLIFAFAPFLSDKEKYW